MRGSDNSDDPVDDAVIENLIESASRYFDRETGQRFYADSTDATRYYTAVDSLVLKIDPLSAAPTSVSIDTTGLRSYTALTINTDFELMPFNALLDGQPYTELSIIAILSAYTWPLTAKGVKVVAKFGFPSVPHDVRDSVIGIAQNLNSARSGQTAGGRITVTAGGVVIRPEDVPTFAQRVIQHYRGYV